ncbi:helix-turn-helix domain-containing protein [Bacillus sp. EAC]|uniref:helix-turn-helix domain-containing protein n=1 Tax=Bacillus sp. EAC TaxID=1978338 RepID=UPI000B43A04A|nr:helix-turn-helix domain-containing protein [Bacillus sp. EAC]
MIELVKRILTDQQVIEIKTKLMNGVSNVELTREYEVSSALIADIKKMKTYKNIFVQGCNVRPKPPVPQTLVSKLLLEGVVYNEIAEKCGVNKATIVRIRKKWKQKGLLANMITTKD